MTCNGAQWRAMTWSGHMLWGSLADKKEGKNPSLSHSGILIWVYFRIQNFDADLTFGVPSLFIDFIEVKTSYKVFPFSLKMTFHLFFIGLTSLYSESSFQTITMLSSTRNNYETYSWNNILTNFHQFWPKCWKKVINLTDFFFKKVMFVFCFFTFLIKNKKNEIC